MLPNVEIFYQTDNYLIFDLKGTILEANKLRKTIISEVPTFAIDTVTVHQNDSILDDMFLA